MSKYNIYAKKLDTAFRDVQEAYAAEVAKLNAAQKARDNAFAWSSERAQGIAASLEQAERQAVTIALQAAKEAFAKAARQIVDNYRVSVESLKQELSEAVDAANLVDPAAVDSSALALLNSGIMTAADYRHMLEQFADNPTMCRMIGKYAGDAVAAARDNRQESAALRAVHIEAGRDSYSVIDTFNALADASIRYMGASSPERHEFSQQMQAHWDDGDIREAIDNF